MSTRKRKLGKVQEDVEKPIEVAGTHKVAVPKQNPVAAVVGQAQSNEAFHTKYIKELQQIYKKVRVTICLEFFQIQFFLFTIYSLDMRLSFPYTKKHLKYSWFARNLNRLPIQP